MPRILVVDDEPDICHMIRRYALLILDEPTAAMDMESTLAAEECIRRYCDEQARRLADQIIVLHEGKLIEQGDTERVLASPREEQTRRFLEFFGI